MYTGLYPSLTFLQCHSNIYRQLFFLSGTCQSEQSFRRITYKLKKSNLIFFFISVLQGSNIPHPWNINKQKLNITFMDTEQTTGGSLSTEQHPVSLTFFLDVAKICGFAALNTGFFF